MITNEKKQSRLLALPYELREPILQFALKQKGTVELQHPVWTNLDLYCQPLFQTCRSLRIEALEAFYKTNDFLWIIDVEHKKRSNPTTYPKPASVTDNIRTWRPVPNPVLTPVLPWEYPNLMRDLRRLQLNLYLPDEDAVAKLRQTLAEFVEAVDAGDRLAHVHVLITANRRARDLILSAADTEAIEVLCGMEIRGKVEVQTRTHFRAMSDAVKKLGLARRMKA